MPSVEILVTAFLAVMVVASFIALRARVPYTLVLVFLGILLAFTSALPALGQGPIQNIFESIVNQMSVIYNQMVAGSEGGLFVGLVVPPLLFEAMLHIKSTDLRSSIKPAIILATVGVLISTLVGGFILWKLAGLSLSIAFLFSSLISPTDVATVLEIFRRVRVPSRLATLMDTEAAFNDATGIVAFSVVLASISLKSVPVISALSGFALTFAGGVLIGLLVAFVSELVTSLTSDRLTETILTIASVYGSYALASSLGASGLIAVTVVGLYFGNITFKSAMGPSSREAVELFWEFAAFVGNSVAFLFIGFRTDVFKLAAAIIPILLAYVAVTAARAASTYPILTLLDRFGDKIPLKWRNVTMLGGMRGALSIALAASIPLTVISSSDSSTISTLVLGVAFISISLQAAFLFRYIKRRFPEEQAGLIDSLDVRLSNVVEAIESLRKSKLEGSISDAVYADRLERERDEMKDVLKEIEAVVDSKHLLRIRASELYSSVLTLPSTRARQVFGLGRKKSEEEKKTSEPKEEKEPES
ncbi:MAG: sodium:proton antiporter [Nitrososphaerota archaeon]|nr:sodium:proton antiporter [Nitrososphaerota archaeon]